MQEFGDSVAVLPDDETTPGALRAEIERLRQREVELDHQMLAKIARRRYLDSLKDANLAEDGCLICANTEIGQSESLLSLSPHAMYSLICSYSGSDPLWALHAREMLAHMVHEIRIAYLPSLSGIPQSREGLEKDTDGGGRSKNWCQNI